MNTTTTIATDINQQSVSPYDSASIPNESGFESLDNLELEMARIMFDEFEQGLLSDIPLADI